MRYFYLFACALLAQTTLVAQAIGPESAPQIGDRWLTGFAPDLSRDQYPVPVAGSTGVLYDFTGVGDSLIQFEENGPTIRVADVPADSLVPFRILDLPTPGQYGDGETVVDFPAGTVVSDADALRVFFGVDTSNFEPIFIETRADGIFQVGTGCVEDGEYFDVEADPGGTFPLLPFGLNVGDVVVFDSTETGFDPDEMSFDTSRTFRRIEYIGTGDLRTHFGEYDGVDILLVRDSFISRSVGDGFDIEFSISSTFYGFYQAGNYQPVVQIFIDEETDPDDGNLIFPELQYLYARPVFLTDVADQVAEELQLTTYPNPATDLLNVSLTLEAATEVRLTLLAADGRAVAGRTYGNRGAGAQQYRFDVPAHVAAGQYFLRVDAGGRVTARPVVVR